MNVDIDGQPYPVTGFDWASSDTTVATVVRFNGYQATVSAVGIGSVTISPCGASGSGPYICGYLTVTVVP